MSDTKEDTTNETLKEFYPDLVYQRIVVDRTDGFTPFDGRPWSDTGLDGVLRIDDEIMLVAEIVDKTTMIVGRKP